MRRAIRFLFRSESFDGLNLTEPRGTGESIQLGSIGNPYGNYHPLVSIVVIAYSLKRAKDLKDLLQSIDVQSYDAIELIIVIERDERLYQFAMNLSIKQSKSVYFTSQRLGVSRSRNLGVSLSKGEIIAFVDDDAVLASDWATSLVRDFDSEFIGVTGRVLPLWQFPEPLFFPKSMYWMLGCTAWKDTASPHRTHFATGTNMAFRREAFANCRFELDIYYTDDRTKVHKGLSNDDNDFAVRLTTSTKRSILYDPALLVYHKVYPERMKMSFVKDYAFWQGFDEGRYRSRPGWKMARQNEYSNFARSVINDLFGMQGGVTASLKRLMLVCLAFSSAALGCVAFACNLYPELEN